jgi:hypothetical protein
MKLFKYCDFISESTLNLLLEANISFTKNFITILGKVAQNGSDVAKKIIDTEGTEVDINQNYIDVNKDKTDMVFFKPDDKVQKVAKVELNSNYQLGGMKDFTWELSQVKETGVTEVENLDDIILPESGQMGQIIREYTLSETQNFSNLKIKEMFRNLYNNTFIQPCLFQWNVGRKKHQIVIDKRDLITGTDAIKNSEVSVGRFARALLTKAGQEFTDAEIEQFVYKYRAEVEKEKDVLNTRFKVLTGYEIKKYYHRSSYKEESGSLGSSCMRYDRCQKYLGIYTNNSQVSLLVLFAEDDNTKITGRAILWEIEPYELSTKVMDRIYTIKTADEQLFKEWAINNGYWYKEKQDYSEYTNFLFHTKDGDIETRSGDFSVSLDNSGEYSAYPYMDSFKYYNVRKGILYTSCTFDYDYELTDTEGGNGSCSECGGRGEVECTRCDGDSEIECGECDGDGSIRCDDCDGSGEQECPKCDGYGELDCSECSGKGEIDCSSCDGSGEDDEGGECQDCEGSGRESCSDCSGNGKEECSRCDGDGTIGCRECSGDGSVECGDCDGSGQVECYNCDGTGRMSCQEC